MKQAKHLSMIRSFHLADWFTLGNAACGVGALFVVAVLVIVLSGLSVLGVL